MPRCIDCSHYNRINKRCGVLKSGLSFPPTVEVACRAFEERKEEEGEGGKG